QPRRRDTRTEIPTDHHLQTDPPRNRRRYLRPTVRGDVIVRILRPASAPHIGLRPSFGPPPESWLAHGFSRNSWRPRDRASIAAAGAERLGLPYSERHAFRVLRSATWG